MSEKMELNVENPAFENRPPDWDYSLVSYCIKKAVESIRENGGKDISFKVQFEQFMTTEFWIPNEVPTIPDDLP